MKRDLLKVWVVLTLVLFSNERTQASDECDCYLEYKSLEQEAEVYADEKAQNQSVTEFSEKVRIEIQEATALLADG